MYQKLLTATLRRILDAIADPSPQMASTDLLANSVTGSVICRVAFSGAWFLSYVSTSGLGACYGQPSSIGKRTPASQRSELLLPTLCNCWQNFTIPHLAFRKLSRQFKRLPRSQQVGHVFGTTWTLEHFGYIYASRGDHEDAIMPYEAAANTYSQTNTDLAIQ